HGTAPVTPTNPEKPDQGKTDDHGTTPVTPSKPDQGKTDDHKSGDSHTTTPTNPTTPTTPTDHNKDSQGKTDDHGTTPTTPTVPGDKVTVKDPSHLTDDEKKQVKNNVDNANKDKFPAGTDVTV